MKPTHELDCETTFFLGGGGGGLESKLESSNKKFFDISLSYFDRQVEPFFEKFASSTKLYR
jgi:hypothetical protein